jgi:hypothetical protein
MLTVHSISIFHRLASPPMHRRVQDASSTLFLFWAQITYGKVFEGRRKLLRTDSGTDACVNIDSDSFIPIYHLQLYWFIPYDSVSTQRIIQRRTTNILLRLVQQYCTTEIIQRRKTVTAGYLFPCFPFSCSGIPHSPVSLGYIYSFTSSSSSCSWRVDSQDAVGPSISSTVFLCSFVLLVHIVVLVLLSHLCPPSVRVVATFSATVLFPLPCSVLPFFP